MFSAKLSSVRTGQVITIFAKCKEKPDRFEIEFVEGNLKEIPFHLSVRFNEVHEIVRNSHTELDGWGNEERIENLISGNIAIKAGQDFKISIYIDVDQFFVSIDNKPFCTFAHRSDYRNIQRLNVLNDVEKVYRLEHESSIPKNLPKAEDVFYASIPRSFNIGDIILINGIARGSDQGNITLRIIDGVLKRSLFHMKTDLSDESLTVNSQCSNFIWQQEEKLYSSSYPFSLNTPFKIAIVYKESDFSLVVNGEILCIRAYTEDIEKMFSTMNQIEIIARNETKIEVDSFEIFSMQNEDGDFESWIADIIY